MRGNKEREKKERKRKRGGRAEIEGEKMRMGGQDISVGSKMGSKGEKG